MKRNIDLARTILLAIEAGDFVVGLQVKIDGHDEREIAYHVAMLGQAGLLKVVDCTMIDAFPQALPLQLTWAGHDFIDAARDPGIWEAARKKFLTPATGAAFDVVLEWMKQQARAHLGLD